MANKFHYRKGGSETYYFIVAQALRQSDLSFKKWMELDEKYIRERSLRTDFKIILKTVSVVLTGRE
jgi:lipopolysaccharide/colanic/teichoic acid biosynthesis glycosyltransferase